jgi:hypothetical protein
MRRVGLAVLVILSAAFGASAQTTSQIKKAAGDGANTGAAARDVASADEILVLELQPSRLGCESPEWLRRAKWLPNSGIACEIEFLFVLDTVRQY